VSKESPRHPIIYALCEIVPQLAQAIGEDVEVVLHELTHPQDSLVAIAGDVTGRSVGAPLTDMVQSMLLRGQIEDRINYSTRTADGRQLRSSTIFIRDTNEQPIACLCINFDITKWLIARHITASYCAIDSLEDEAEESFDGDVESMLDRNISEALAEDAVPVAMMKKEDKLRVVRRLEKVGVFQIKGAVASVARALSVSRYTIYNYLDEIRGEKTDQRVIRPSKSDT
jgi:predicted transcriptional regulator YheO